MSSQRPKIPGCLWQVLLILPLRKIMCVSESATNNTPNCCLDHKPGSVLAGWYQQLACSCAGSLFWMLEAPAHNGSALDAYAIFTNASMYQHNPQRPNPMPPPLKGKAPDPVSVRSASI